MVRNIDEAAAFAANWWANRVDSPTFDNGMYDKQGRFASSLASALTVPFLPVVRDKFKEICIKRVTEELKKNGYVSLDSDYAPEGVLCEIMKESGAPTDNSPWKTSMYICKAGSYSDETPYYRIKVKCGYGDPMNEI